MPGRTRGWAGAAALAALLCLLVAVPASGQEGRPALWSGEAGAAGVRVYFTTEPPAVPVPELVDFRIPDGHTTWDSSGLATARASSVYPGAAGIGGVQLLCDFGAPCPDALGQVDYPFTAFAEHPTQPDAETTTGLGRAHAGNDFVASSARFGNVVPLGPLAEVVRLGSGSSVTRQEFVPGDTLAVQATTTLTDVVLGGGALVIDAVELVSVSRATAAGATSSASVTIAGVRTDGGEVIVGDDGVTIAGQGGGEDAIGQLNDALATALDGTGVAARVVGVDVSEDGARSRAQATGLSVSLTREVSGPGVPGADRLYRAYVAQVVLGDVSTTAYATDDAFGVSMDGLADVPGAPAPGAAAMDTGGSFPAGADASSGTAAPPAGGSTGGSAATQGSDPAGEPPAPAVAPVAGSPDADENGGFTLLAGDASRAVSTGYGGLLLVGLGVVVLSRLAGRRLVGG